MRRTRTLSVNGASGWAGLFHFIVLLALMGSLFTMVPSARAASLCYVKANAGGANNGTSWANAYTSLQSALSGCSEVWVAAGVYKPGGNRANTFNIPPGVGVYGGFAGTESALSQRNPGANITILSGDIDNNDANGDGNHIDETTANIVGNNSYHVVSIIGTSTPVTASTVLDGFTITGGQANGAAPNDSGGGLYCHGEGSGHSCNPTLANLNFSGNKAASFGGAVFDNGWNSTSSPAFTNVIFSGNAADSHGGAIFNNGCPGTSSPAFTNVIFNGNHTEANGGAIYSCGTNGVSSPSFTDVSFDNNSAKLYGGAVYNEGATGASSPTFTRVTFNGNHATLDGGAIYNSGEFNGVSSPTLVNVTFYNNRADGYAGGMYNDSESGVNGISKPTLTNVTFTLNHAGKYGGAIINDGAYGGGTSRATLTNVILWGDTAGVAGPEIFNGQGNATASVDYSVVQGGCGSITGVSCGSHNLSTDPKLGTLASHGGFTQTVALSAGSSAVDMGTDTGCPANDQRGAIRPQDGNGDSVAICDIGAYEKGPYEVPTSGSMVFRSSGSVDGWVLESGENTSAGGTLNATSALRLGDDASRRQYRSILSFKTAGLPDTAVISSVQLQLQFKSLKPAATDPIALLGGIMVDIRKGFFGSAYGLEVGDFQASAQKTVGPFFPTLSGGYYTITLDSSTFAYINKLTTRAGLTQIRLRFKQGDNNNGAANILNLVSGNSTAVASRPTLIISYTVP